MAISLNNIRSLNIPILALSLGAWTIAHKAFGQTRVCITSRHWIARTTASCFGVMIPISINVSPSFLLFRLDITRPFSSLSSLIRLASISNSPNFFHLTCTFESAIASFSVFMTSEYTPLHQTGLLISEQPHFHIRRQQLCFYARISVPHIGPVKSSKRSYSAFQDSQPYLAPYRRFRKIVSYLKK